ncbi:tungsten formylmethanofuran dehydrogenase [Candidatus Gracilibacteria bacterium]|nr:tungsten formylmethanofuran dehydrogenase [Candidatus Gracilibacteria bacterium]
MQSIGLDGTIVAHTKLGAIDGTAGRLSYSGYSVQELAEHTSWEEVLFLLWYGRLPRASELAAMSVALAEERVLRDEELVLLRSLPRNLHGMDAARLIVTALAGQHKPTLLLPQTIYDDGLRLAARLPTLLTTWARLRQGLTPVTPDPALGHAANMLLTLHGRAPSTVEVAALNCYMVLLAEHGLNVSTFVARVVASTQNDLYAAIDAALATLKGLAHGGANEYAMRTFLAIETPDRVPAHIAGMLDRKERLMGVGHRIYKVADPRVRWLRHHSAALAQQAGVDGRGHAVAEAVAEHVLQHPHFQARTLYPNVEFYSAPLLYALGLPLDLFTVAFAAARMAGWVAHIREQLDTPRLMRPEAEYIGPEPRTFVALAQRG